MITIKSIQEVRSGNKLDVILTCDINGNENKIKHVIESPCLDRISPIGPEFAIPSVIAKAIFGGHDIYCHEKIDPVFYYGIKLYKNRIICHEKKNKGWSGFLYNVESAMKKINIVMPDPDEEIIIDRKRRIGLMFSGGVDAWYSLISIPEITDIFFITNLNVPESIAIKSVHEVRPEIVSHTVESGAIGSRDGPYGSWVMIGSGVNLYSTALLFQNLLTQMIISGDGHGVNEDISLADGGSGQDVDYLMSTSKMRFFTYGIECREKKLLTLASHPKAKEIFSTLQVCPRARTPGKINCSACPKCIPTMIMLKNLGLHGIAKSFIFEGLEKRIPTMEADPMGVSAIKWMYDSIKDPELKKACEKWRNI